MLSYKTVLFALTYLALSASALPIRREVPQEHSHEAILISVRKSLNLNNPDGISDVVFGLLGNAAAATGAGKIADPTCLQQATADQAFTNAKAAGDVQGQVDALIFRALERNSGSVGGVTAKCTSITAVNPEIAAITQHQDPASTGAAAGNKAITLELAKQIASVGGNPVDALLSGTFAPGTIGDPTGKGNTCDDANDVKGCIFTQNLIVFDATEEEIQAAVGGVAAPPATETTAAAEVSVTATATESAVDASATCPPPTTVTVTAGAGATEVAATTEAAATTTAAAEATAAPAPAPAPVSSAPAPAGTAPATAGNLQGFAGALGGVVAPTVLAAGTGFQVTGNASFNSLRSAVVRSCDVQNNQCANAANASGNKDGFNVGACNAQQATCIGQAPA